MDTDTAALNLSSSELRRRLQQQELVAGFGRVAIQADGLVAVLDQASVVAARGLETEFAKVLQFLPAENAFVVRSGTGWKEGVVGHARLDAGDQSPAGHAFQTRKPVVSNDLSNEQRFRTPDLLTEHGIRSAINVLISSSVGGPFGVLECDSTHRSQFGTHDVVFLEALANTLALAVDAHDRQQVLFRQNEALLRDKDLLMQEVHHRVTNSLQLVGSILIMQARNLTNAEAKIQVEEAAGRITTIGAVHRRLYEGGSVATVDAARYLRGLFDDIGGLLPSGAAGRALDLEMDPISLSADDITPLGLITGELITNALKHGRGRVRVLVRQEANGLELSVSDEGPGFPADFNPAASGGLGMRLVATLAKEPRDNAIHVDRSVPFGRIVVRTAFGGAG